MKPLIIIINIDGSAWKENNDQPIHNPIENHEYANFNGTLNTSTDEILRALANYDVTDPTRKPE